MLGAGGRNPVGTGWKEAAPPMPAPRPEISDLLEVDIPPGGTVITVSDLHLPPARSDVSGRSCETLAGRLDTETRKRAMAELRSAPWFAQADAASRPVVKTSPHPLFGKVR